MPFGTRRRASRETVYFSHAGGNRPLPSHGCWSALRGSSRQASNLTAEQTGGPIGKHEPCPIYKMLVSPSHYRKGFSIYCLSDARLQENIRWAPTLLFFFRSPHVYLLFFELYEAHGGTGRKKARFKQDALPLRPGQKGNKAGGYAHARLPIECPHRPHQRIIPRPDISCYRRIIICTAFPGYPEDPYPLQEALTHRVSRIAHP